MAKTKITFFCRACGAESPKWMGQCQSCKEWNTLIEEKIVKTKNERLDNKTDWRSVNESPPGGSSPSAMVGKGPRPIQLEKVVASNLPTAS
jgi:DNA repair protein RadA/Sms